ncbi:MAG: NAD(P)H-binding protein, partial [Longimicrobiales bacterium]
TGVYSVVRHPIYTAVVIGATGAVGGSLVRELLASPRCAGVTALTRRAVEDFEGLPGRDKLRIRVIDFAGIDAATRQAASGCQVAFCTLGVGQPRKVSANEHWRVDVEYTGAFARGAAAAGVRHISLLSSVGADESSRSRYLRVKGAAERAFIGAGIPRTSFFRPSLLVTREIRYGLQDRLTQAFSPVLATLLPARFHPIRVEDLARERCA